MSMSKLPIYLLGMLGLFMHQTSIAAQHAIKPIAESRARVTMPCLIGSTGLAEKVIDFSHTKGPFVAYRPFGFPVSASTIIHINTKPKDLSEAKNKQAIANGFVYQINQTAHTAKEWISGNLLFDGVALFNPWMMGYFAFMGPNVALHNLALIMGNANFPVSGTVGLFHIPFGLNATEDLDGGLTGKLGTGENTTAIALNWEPTLFNNHTFRIKSFVFSPKTSDKEDAVSNTHHYGLNAHYEAKQDDISWAFGASYATRLVKSATEMQGINGYANIGLGPFKVKAEGVMGYNLLPQSIAAGKNTEPQSVPYAFTLEGSIHGIVMNRDSAIVGGFSRGENGAFLEGTDRIYVALKHTLSKRVKLALAGQQDTLWNARASTGTEEKPTAGSSKSAQEPKRSVNLQLAFTIT